MPIKFLDLFAEPELLNAKAKDIKEIDDQVDSPLFSDEETETILERNKNLKNAGPKITKLENAGEALPNWLIYIAVAIVCILAVWLIYSIFKQVKIEGEDYQQRRTHLHFNNIAGEEFNDDAKLAIQHGENIENPRAIDHYRIGTVYLLNARDPHRAHEHFAAALNQIIDGTVDIRETPFILDRIRDFADRFVDFEDIDDLPLQNAIFADANNRINIIEQVARKRESIKEDDPEFVQKTLLSRQDWQSDSQNVHDTAIYEELKSQLDLVRSENVKIKDIQLHDYNEAINWLKVRYKSGPEYAKLSKVLDLLTSNYPVGVISGISEQDIITAIWQRSYDPENAKNASVIREALGDALLDCVEGGHTVCMTGRASKEWQALAKLDKDPNIGVLKTKQMLRNEIYERAAKVVESYIGESGSASAQLKEAYNTGVKDAQVQELIECVREQIGKIADDYKDLLDDAQLRATIEECKMVV